MGELETTGQASPAPPDEVEAATEARPSDQAARPVTLQLPRWALVTILAVFLMGGAGVVGYFIGENRGEDRGRERGQAAGDAAGYRRGLNRGIESATDLSLQGQPEVWMSGFDCGKGVIASAWVMDAAGNLPTITEQSRLECRLGMPPSENLRLRMEGHWDGLETRWAEAFR